ncbi:translation initiation factor IF-2 N-terminal domain-containing protein, partial [Enemella evansiae]
MAKPRVYEIAKELGLESKQVLKTLNDMGEFVRSASSTVEAPVVRRLRDRIESEQGGGSKEKAAKAPAKKAAAKSAPAPAAEKAKADGAEKPQPKAE